MTADRAPGQGAACSKSIEACTDFTFPKRPFSTRDRQRPSALEGGSRRVAGRCPVAQNLHINATRGR
jgi:hypothetical protein